ncbi:hypothetical protein L1987_25151 [Smallanthus sonchifolius]|uniref:Uncharacterized protein n=1 Tax=Smallanthus sonchifolius TaxID=185202 RepID=A0ACB9IMZ2_9ASTR|nr:hypothetical protein L1987_25151 [Smallanthus sonchifolius]
MGHNSVFGDHLIGILFCTLTLKLSSKLNQIKSKAVRFCRGHITSIIFWLTDRQVAGSAYSLDIVGVQGSNYLAGSNCKFIYSIKNSYVVLSWFFYFCFKYMPAAKRGRNQLVT